LAVFQGKSNKIINHGFHELTRIKKLKENTKFKRKDSHKKAQEAQKRKNQVI